MSRRAMIIGGSTVGLVLLVVGTAFAVATARSDEVLQGVTVEGVDVGGLGLEEARTRLAILATARSSESVTLTHAGEEYLVDAVGIGAAVDVDALVGRALGAGRTGSFLGDRMAALGTTPVELEVDVEPDLEALEARVAQIAAAIDTDAFVGDITINPVTLDVDAADPTAGVRMLQPDTIDLVVTALDQPGTETIEVPVEIIEPATDPADVARVAATARAAIAEELELTSSEGSVVLSPRELAALIEVEPVGDEQDASLRLVVTQESVRDVVVPLAGPLLRDARNADYTAPAVPGVRFDDKFDTTWSPVPAEVTLVPGRTGTEVETERAAQELTAALTAAERELRLPLAEFPPDFPTELARQTQPDHLLSTFTTYHACCQTRVANIQRLADLVDHALVLPGEQFSINQISGVRECSKGFKPAGMILDGEIVDSCGGGVSQFGTTTVNALFFAGFQPDAYKPHSFYISRYPMAREATLNFPSPDLDVRFTNDSGSPVLVRTSHTSTSITVSFYGSSDVRSVSADVGSPRNVKPYPTVRRVNRELPAGTETRIQGGKDGFRVSLTRTIVRTDGGIETDDWSNTYVPETEIFEYNPDQPKPTPTPSPSPLPSPSPTPTPPASDSEPDSESEG